MSTQGAGKMVGLGLPKAAAAEEPKEGTVSTGLTGLGSSAAAKPAGLTSLGASSTQPAGLTGLGSSAAKPAGLASLGASAAKPSGLASLGASAAKPTGLASLGASGAKPPGLAALGSTPAPAQAPAAAPAPAPRKSGIAIHETAAARIQKLLGDRGTPAAGLRIRVRGGGCTGLTYDMEFAEDAKERDRVFEGHGVKIFVDPKSYIFLIGTELTYQSGLMESGFKLENPNAKKSCGCGDSFSV